MKKIFCIIVLILSCICLESCRPYWTEGFDDYYCPRCHSYEGCSLGYCRIYGRY